LLLMTFVPCKAESICEAAAEQSVHLTWGTYRVFEQSSSFNGLPFRGRIHAPTPSTPAGAYPYRVLRKRAPLGRSSFAEKGIVRILNHPLFNICMDFNAIMERQTCSTNRN
jgi:hypothetical protein